MDLGGYACAHVCILTGTYICILPLGGSRKAMNGCLGLTRDIYSCMYVCTYVSMCLHVLHVCICAHSYFCLS